MNSQWRALQRFLRVSVLAAALIFFGESFLIAFKDGFWSLQFKTILCAIGLLPPLVAAICFWLYDYRVLHPVRSPKLRIAEVFALLFFLSPSLWIATRNSLLPQSMIRDLNRWWLGLLLPVVGGWIWIAASRRSEEATGAHRYIRDIFWDTLIVGHDSQSLVVDESIARIRRGHYTNRASIEVFQDSFLGTSAEAILLADAISGATSLLQSHRLRVLDIGCSTGRFAAALTQGLLRSTSLHVERVVGVDAAEFELDFRSTLQESTASVPVDFIPGRWQDIVLEHQHRFNLVICSHSLYEALDTTHDGDSNPLDLLTSVVGPFLAHRHLLYISLASGQSDSYHFKRQFLNECFGVPVHDATFEGFLDLSARGSFRRLYSEAECGALDTYLRIPETCEDKLAFGRYFLRCPLEKSETERYCDLLEASSHRFKRLHKCIAEDAQAQAAHGGVHLNQNSQLIFHRTRFCLYSRNNLDSGAPS